MRSEKVEKHVIASKAKQSHGLQLTVIIRLLRRYTPRNDLGYDFLRNVLSVNILIKQIITRNPQPATRNPQPVTR